MNLPSWSRESLVPQVVGQVVPVLWTQFTNNSGDPNFELIIWQDVCVCVCVCSLCVNVSNSQFLQPSFSNQPIPIANHHERSIQHDQFLSSYFSFCSTKCFEFNLTSCEISWIDESLKLSSRHFCFQIVYRLIKYFSSLNILTHPKLSSTLNDRWIDPR